MTANVPLPPSGGSGGFPASLSGDRLLRGTPARWNETANWTDRDGLPLTNKTMFVIGYTTALERWKDKKAETKTEHPLPDPTVLNNTIPLAEWEIGLDGKTPQPPWKLVYVIYMIDLRTGAIFTYKNSTYGAKLVCEQLEEQIAVMRMLRGEHVLPIVRLEKRPMKTQFGMKSRPHLQILEWRKPGGGGDPTLTPLSPTPQLAGPATVAAQAPAATAPSAAPPVTPSAASPPVAAPAAAPTPPASTILAATQPVEPVTVAELIADELPPWA